MAAALGAGPRRERGGAIALVAGTFVNGVAAFAFIALGTRDLGAAGFAPVSVLWTLWALSTAAITFPLQHWVVRVREVEGDLAAVRAALPAIVLAVVALMAIFGATSWAFRQQLFGPVPMMIAAAAALIPAGSASVGLVRGRLAADGRLRATATAIAAENILRVAVAVVAAILSVGVGGYIGAVVAGFAVAAMWPRAFSFGAATGRRAGLPLLTGIALAALVAQVVLTAPPLVLAAIEDDGAVITSLFAAMTITRAPYLVMLGLAVWANPRLTALRERDGGRALSRIRDVGVIAGVAGAVIVAFAATVIGGPLLELLFGDRVTLPPSAIAGVAAGGVLALVSLFLTMVLVARGNGGGLTSSWLVALGAGTFAAVAIAQPAVGRIAWAFAIAEASAVAAMLVVDALASRANRPV